MTYREAGYTKLLYKNIPSKSVGTEDSNSLEIPILSGSSIGGGITRSTSGKIQIDWDTGQILVGDGANWRVIIGEDGL